MSTDPIRSPLSPLPEEEQLNNISKMHPFECITLSLRSESTKKLLRSSGQECDMLKVTLEDQRGVFIKFVGEGPYFGFYSTKPDDTDIFDRTRLAAHGQNRKEQWTVENFNTKSWIQHLMFIFNRKSIKLSVRTNKYNLESIQKTFSGIALHKLTIANIGEEYTANLLKVLPYTEEIKLHGTCGPSELLRLSVQNLRRFHSGENLVMKLADIISINSLHIYIRRTALTTKDLNRFLKLWRNGSNPRLQSIKIIMPLDSDTVKVVKHKIMEGIRHQLESYFFVIYRMDGTRAEVRVNFGPHPVFEMNVDA